MKFLKALKIAFAFCGSYFFICGLAWGDCSELGSIERDNVSCDTTEDINLEKIDNHARNVILKTKGSIHVREKVDGNSSVKLVAGKSIYIGQKIDGHSLADLEAGIDIVINQKIDGNSTVTLDCGGDISIGQKVDGGSTIRWHAAKAHWGAEGIRSANVTQF